MTQEIIDIIQVYLIITFMEGKVCKMASSYYLIDHFASNMHDIRTGPVTLGQSN